MSTASLLVSILAVTPQQPPAFDFATAWGEVKALMHTECEKYKVVGGSLMFVKGAEVLGLECHGFADQEGARLVDRDTIFHWASCTKTFTGIALMQLRDRGLLRLDQPIVEFVPELRQTKNPFGKIEDITIQHLMSHSGGFRGVTWPWGGEAWHPHEPTEWSQLVAMMPYTDVQFAPGSKFSYSNPGIVFLGQAIERLTGDDYEVYVQKNLFAPLGMQRTYFDVTPYHLQKHRSHSYAGTKDLGPDFDTGITVSNGGLNAPLPDMARYLAFLLGAVEDDSYAAGVLARESLTTMWQPLLPTSRTGAEHMGLTFFVSEIEGQRVASHTGGQRSFVTFFYVHSASGTGALGAFNTESSGPAMASLRRACLERLSLPMAKKSE